MRPRHTRMVLAVCALIAVALVGAVLAARGSASADSSAPAWLQTATQKIVSSQDGTASTTSADWVLTTVGAYHDVMPDAGAADEAYATKPLYVVFVDGSFSASHAIDTDAIPLGKQLVLSFDADTHELSVLGIMPTPVDPAKMGDAKQMSL